MELEHLKIFSEFMIPPTKIAIIERIKLVADYLKQSCYEIFGSGTEVMILSGNNGIIETLERLSPEMIVIGCDLGIRKDISILERIKLEFAGAKLIVLCQTINRSQFRFVSAMGISDVVTMQNDISEFKEKITRVWNGDTSWEPVQFDEPVFFKSKQVGFTDKEIAILNLVRQQQTTKEISDQLGIHIKTVEFHKAKMMEKTNCTKMVGVLDYALVNSII